MWCHIREQHTLLLSNTDIIKGRREPQLRAQWRQDKDKDLRRDLMDENFCQLLICVFDVLQTLDVPSPIESPLQIQVTGLSRLTFPYQTIRFSSPWFEAVLHECVQNTLEIARK